MTEQGRTGTPRLLVVEDQPNEQSAMARLLRMEGYETSTARNADDALSRISEPVALVITDLRMPGASGIDLLRRWKAQRPSTPFIIVTAYAEVDSAVAAMKLGAKDYLTKPVKPEELLALVSRLVAESAAATDDGVASRACASVSHPAPPASSPAAKEAAATRLEDLEKDAVLRTLEREGGNRTHAARLLGISIRTLQRKLKAWGLTAPGDALDDDQRGRPHVPGDLER